MVTLRISRTLALSTYRPTELLKEEEEHIEPMVVSVHISLLNVMLKCGLLKKLQMSEDKEKVSKLLKEKSQLEKND